MNRIYSICIDVKNEAAEYLEVAEIRLRRWIKAGRLNFNRIGRNFVFDPDELKAFKKGKVKLTH